MEKREISGRDLNPIKESSLGPHTARCYLWHQQVPAGQLAACDQQLEQHGAPSSQVCGPVTAGSPRPEGAVTEMPEGWESKDSSHRGGWRTTGQAPALTALSPALAAFLQVVQTSNGST